MSRLLASAVLVLVAAGPTEAVAQAACEARRRACVAECRAQFFSIDPKRDACVSRCTAEANRCAREQTRDEGTDDPARIRARQTMRPAAGASEPIGPDGREDPHRMAERPGSPARGSRQRPAAAGT